MKIKIIIYDYLKIKILMRKMMVLYFHLIKSLLSDFIIYIYDVGMSCDSIFIGSINI